MQENKNKLLIFDFGSQYTSLIARRIRELGVDTEVYLYDTININKIDLSLIKGIILSGGPQRIDHSKNIYIPKIIFNNSIPILGICYGMQLMAHFFGNKIISSNKSEFGNTEINVHNNSILYDEMPKKQNVWMSHNDHVEINNLFNIIASSSNNSTAAIKHINKPFYGVQYHPEVTHSIDGQQLIKNFIFKICKFSINLTPINIIDNLINKIKKKVVNNKVIIGLSGGVDSSVLTILLKKAIGIKQLTCIFVNTGLLRLNEGNNIMKTFYDSLNLNVIYINAESIFLKKLAGVYDPEKKRHIIGHLFFDIFIKEAKKITNAKFLAQGTIYTDVIESAGNNTKSDKIKSHHNMVNFLSKDIQLIEPLKHLFKDEVRKIGLKLGLPDNIIYQHPFPGPGLAIRIIGSITQHYLNILRHADEIYINELKKSGWYNKIDQAFAIFLPIKSVGVMGDKRKYEFIISLRAVQTVDFMTARWVLLPYDIISKISNRIVNEVQYVSRVVYDITGKPPGTIEWE